MSKYVVVVTEDWTNYGSILYINVTVTGLIKELGCGIPSFSESGSSHLRNAWCHSVTVLVSPADYKNVTARSLSASLRISRNSKPRPHALGQAKP